MTDTTLNAEPGTLPDTLDPDIAHLPEGLSPVEPAYRNVLRTRFLIGWLPLLVGALALDNFVFEEQPFRGYLSLALFVLTVAIVSLAPNRIWRRLGYRIDDTELRIARGWLFHADTVVPFVRVQHLDVARGPLDKLFGTASLIVHTAGTHNSVVTLPGLDPARAIELRDRVRAKIKTDWQ